MGRCQQEILEGRRLPDPPGIPAQLILGPPRPEDPEPDLAAFQPNGLTNRRMRTRMSGGVRGGGATPPPTRFGPDAGRVLFGNYARDWIEERPNLRPKTIQLYLYLLRSHLVPTFSARAMADIREPDVRRWRKNLLDAQVSAVALAKAYRLLKAIFNAAVDDGLIGRNPCRIKGAGQEKSPERPVLTVPQVYALADAVPDRYRALVLLTVFGSLRWGELAALRRPGIDFQARTVRISRQLSEQRGGAFTFGALKSDAGYLTVAISRGDHTGPCLAHRDLCRAG